MVLKTKKIDDILMCPSCGKSIMSKDNNDYLSSVFTTDEDPALSFYRVDCQHCNMTHVIVLDNVETNPIMWYRLIDIDVYYEKIIFSDYTLTEYELKILNDLSLIPSDGTKNTISIEDNKIVFMAIDDIT